jgi:hypothetical protein
VTVSKEVHVIADPSRDTAYGNGNYMNINLLEFPIMHIKNNRPLHDRLLIPFTVKFLDGEQHEVKALIDTGASVNLISRTLVNTIQCQISQDKLHLYGANNQAITGGTYETYFDLMMDTHDLDQKKPTCISIGMGAYVADISKDLIISYAWLASNHILVDPKRHGILLMGMPGHIYWKSGIQETKMAEQHEVVTSRACNLESIPMEHLKADIMDITHQSTFPHPLDPTDLDPITTEEPWNTEIALKIEPNHLNRHQRGTHHRHRRRDCTTHPKIARTYEQRHHIGFMHHHSLSFGGWKTHGEMPLAINTSGKIGSDTPWSDTAERLYPCQPPDFIHQQPCGHRNNENCHWNNNDRPPTPGWRSETKYQRMRTTPLTPKHHNIQPWQPAMGTMHHPSVPPPPGLALLTHLFDI